VLLSSLIVAPAWTASKGGKSSTLIPPLAKAKWIWDKADTGKSKHYVCLLRKSFTLDAEPLAAAAVVTADNNYELFINGTRVGGDVGQEDAHWNRLKRHDITKLLRKGPNAVVIRGVNVGGVGGAVAAFRIQLPGDRPGVVDIVTDATWRKSRDGVKDFSSPALVDKKWKRADVLGPMGRKPWGWLAKGPAPPGRSPRSFEEPETVTLSAEQAAAALEADWIHQAEGKPLGHRALQEIAWARETAARLAKRDDPPDVRAELKQLVALEKQLNALDQTGTPDARELYLQVRRVKRAILFKDPLVDFTRVVFIDVPDRYPHESMHRVYPQAQLNCVRLLMLDGLHPGGKVTRVAPEVGAGWFWRPEVSFDGRRILFCFRPKADRTFHLYEIGVDGSGLRQLTAGKYDDMDPIYMPDGRIVFLTNRGNSYARCTVGHPSTLVARCDADGRNIYILSGGGEPEYTPALMPDGQILYTRWEYTDKELMRIQSLWTVNPDGTGTSVFWGNQSYWPDMLMEARPIPGSTRVMFAGHGHHQVYRGSIGIVDTALGRNYPDGLTHVTWDTPWPEVGNGPAERMETPDYHSAGAFSGYKSPYPLSEEVFLVSARPGKGPHQLYLMDVYGNRELIYRGAWNILYPMPIRPRPKPPVIPDQVEWAGAQKDGRPVKPGYLYCPDVFRGAPQADALKQKARYLRVLNLDYTTFTLGKKLQDMQHPKGQPHMHVGPVMSVTCNDGIKRVLGTVPIQPDGSVYFEVPPCKSLHFQLLDGQHRALHTMRSFTNVMPGERRGCVGCHEMHSVTPSRQRGAAMRKAPARLEPYPWGPEYSLGYERDIQPILDRYCGKCHQGDGKGRKKLDLTLRPSKDFGTFPEPYVTLTLGRKRSRGSFPGVCEGGIAGTILAEAKPWKPADYATLPPMKNLSCSSKLIEIASSGKHNKVKVDEVSRLKLILWVDTLCPYRGEREVREMDDPDPAHPLFARSSYPPSDRETVQDVYAQSPYRPRMRTAPIVNRAYRQDEFPTLESRLPRDAEGNVIPPVLFTPDGRRIFNRFPGPSRPNRE